MNQSSAETVRSAEDGSISEAVILAVSEATETDPIELEPLYDYVDPDALDRLFRTRGGLASRQGTVVFTMDGCEVTVHADGTVVATDGSSQVEARPREAGT